MRRLKPPTLWQWGCVHQWKVTKSHPNRNGVLRTRYMTCKRCELRVKTEERLAVPWNEQDLVALVKGLLTEGQPVYLRDQGITELPLYELNGVLERQGYVIHAAKVRDATRFVRCTDKQGRMERYGLFDLRQTSAARPRPHERETAQGGIAPRCRS